MTKSTYNFVLKMTRISEIPPTDERPLYLVVDVFGDFWISCWTEATGFSDDQGWLADSLREPVAYAVLPDFHRDDYPAKYPSTLRDWALSGLHRPAENPRESREDLTRSTVVRMLHLEDMNIKMRIALGELIEIIHEDLQIKEKLADMLEVINGVINPKADLPDLIEARRALNRAVVSLSDSQYGRPSQGSIDAAIKDMKKALDIVWGRGGDHA